MPDPNAGTPTYPQTETHWDIRGRGKVGSAYAGPEYRNALGQKGTGLSGGPIYLMGFGRANVQKTKKFVF